MTNSQRQHGIGSLAPDEKIVGKPGGRVEPGVKQYGIFKKIKKFGKKIFKSPLGKAALIGGGIYGLGKLGAFSKLGGGTGGNWLSKGMGWGKNLIMGTPAVGGPPNLARAAKPGLWGLMKKYPGQSALLGAGALGVAAPFLGGDEEDDVVEQAWDVTPDSIARIRQMAKDRDKSLAFLPPAESVMSGYYLSLIHI